MNSREALIKTIQHQEPGRIVVDFGGTSVTGIHVLVVQKLRRYYGLEEKPLKVIEPYQMLGEIEDDLAEAMGIDVIGLFPPGNMFGHRQENWKPFKTFWDQEVLVPGEFNTSFDENGDLLMYAAGDMSYPPSAKMPKTSYFFDAIERQKTLDESALDPADNLEEFQLLTEEDLAYWKRVTEAASLKDKGVVATFGGTAIGDIALVPAINLKDPRGIRGVAEWYMSTMLRPDLLHVVFEKQTDIALKNLEKAFSVVGNSIDVIFICGTDFGTQDSQFCSSETYQELYAPYYRKMNDWIHRHTGWKTFKHSCGAVEPLMQHFIDSGFDIINPVQINARDMDPVKLKEKYGNDLVFWGGGADTQKTLPFGTPEEVSEHVKRECEILSVNGGFVFNTVHNIQANTPVENVVAMVETVRKF
ncbi:MAG: methyltransferase [Bacteroidales bacterium]|nr:methyltransferase [Bacteroidales bacterium]